MKKLKLIKKIFSKSKLSSLMIVIQITFILMLVIPAVNVNRDLNEIVKRVENSSLSNSIIYLNKYVYDRDKDRNDLIKNKEEIKKIALESNIVKGISADIIKTSALEGNKYFSIYIYDKYLFETLKPDLIEGEFISDNKDEINTILVNSSSDKYNIGEEINLSKHDKKFNVKISGKITDDFHPITFGSLSNGIINIQKFFEDNFSSNYPTLIIPKGTIVDELISKNIDKEIFRKELVIFLNENASEKEINNLINKIESKDLGYYNVTSESLKQQKFYNENYIFEKLDFYIATVLIVLFTIITVSYYMQRKFYRRNLIYIINGAKKKDVYFGFLSYFSILYLLGFGLFKLITYIFSNQYLYKLNYNRIFLTFSRLETDIKLLDFGILSLGILIIFMLIAMVPIYKLKSNKYMENYKELRG